MNQNDRRIIRQQAAKEIESGRTLSQVAAKYGRTIQWVRDSCRENGIEPPMRGRRKTIEIVKKLNENKKPSQISKEVGVSRQYIYSLLEKATVE